jgi:GntR family transcriptional regulator
VTAGGFQLEDGPDYAYIQLADYIEARISDGTLQPGARLPGERALAEEYQVALGTVRSALRVLRDKELIVTTPSKGTFILRGGGVAR